MREKGSQFSSCKDLAGWFDDIVGIGCRKDVGSEGSPPLSVYADWVNESGEVCVGIYGFCDITGTGKEPDAPVA